MTERYEKSPAFWLGFLNGAQSMARPYGRRGPRENLRSKVSWGNEERRRDEESPGLNDRGFCTDRSPRRGGAGRRIRTPDLLITNQLHYQLCYAGTNSAESAVSTL